MVIRGHSVPTNIICDKRGWKLLKGTLFALAILSSVPAAAGDVLAEPRAVHVTSCDRNCLRSMLDSYVSALAAHAPSRLPIARNAVFSENNVMLPIGDGLWRTFSAAGTYRLYTIDPVAGEAHLFANIEENGHPAILSLRLRVRDRVIIEAETQVTRSAGSSFVKPADMKVRPQMLTVVPPEKRATREQLVSIANSYFMTLQQNDGTMFAPFADGCNRVEDGTQTTNNPGFGRDYSEGSGVDIMALGCRQQFETGFFRYVTRIRDRRFTVIDEEHGLIVAHALFDHAGVMRTVKLTDGKTVPAQFEVPWTWLITELFKVEGGKIQQIEAVVDAAPYNSPTVWSIDGLIAEGRQQ